MEDYPQEILCKRGRFTRESYARYLKTAHWIRVRNAALKRAEYRCQLCNANKRLQVHHRTYANIGHEKAADVIALCDDCHKLFHENRRLGT